MNNTETLGIATVKYKHTANISNITYQGWDETILTNSSLIKLQRSKQYRQQMEQNYQIAIQNKLNCMYGIITDIPYKDTESYNAYTLQTLFINHKNFFLA